MGMQNGLLHGVLFQVLSLDLQYTEMKSFVLKFVLWVWPSNFGNWIQLDLIITNSTTGKFGSQCKVFEKPILKP